MPRGGTTRGLDAGTLTEVRVAQAWFWDGYYVRRGVDVQHRFGSDVSTVTDLDILAYSFDSALKVHKYIGEVKSGKSATTPKPLDRALWARGLRELVGAEAAEVTTAFHPTLSVREYCRRLGVSIQHLDDLETRERRLNINEVLDVGSSGQTIAELLKEFSSYIKTEPELERAYWFLRSEVWFLEPFDAVKRTLGLVREMSKRWPPESDAQATRYARWVFAESISISVLNMVIISGQVNTMSTADFRYLAAGKLSSGDVPLHAIQKLSDRIDEYVSKLLSAADAPTEIRVNAMGAFRPTEPDYAEPLVELLHRLAAIAEFTSRLPRQVDTILFERLVRRRNVQPAVQHRLMMNGNCERLVRLVAAFLRGQFNLPPAVDRVLTAPLSRHDGDPDHVQQTLLLE